MRSGTGPFPVLEGCNVDLRSGHPFWLVRNGLIGADPAPSGSIHPDVLVVGAGITGALVTHSLAEAGIDVVVVDKREVCWGSTAASTALLQYEIDVPLYKLRKIYGREKADRCYLACRDAIHHLEAHSAKLSIDPHFQSKGSIYMAKGKKSIGPLKREFAARKEAGFDVEWWDLPDLRRATGITRPAAIHSVDGAQVDAYRLAHGSLKRAVEMGARVFDRTTVRNYQPGRRGVTAKLEAGGEIHAKQVIFATGYEVKEFLKKRIVKLNSSFAFASEPMADEWPLWKDDCLLWEMASPYLYIRSTEDRRIIVGGADEEFQDPERRDSQLGSKTKSLLRMARNLLPALNLEVAFSWAGTFGETDDGLPYIDKLPDYPRAFFALGFGGNGITYSILAAEMIRDAILGVRNPYEGLFTFDR